MFIVNSYFSWQSASQPGPFWDLQSSCIWEKPKSYFSHLCCLTIYTQVWSVSSPIHLLSQYISLHIHSYHPNGSHVFSHLVGCNTILTSSSAPLLFCNSPLSLWQLKWSFWIATWITQCLSTSYLLKEKMKILSFSNTPCKVCPCRHAYISKLQLALFAS